MGVTRETSSYAKRAIGGNGFKIIVPGDGTVVGEFMCIVPDLTGEATFSAESAAGDDLSSGTRYNDTFGVFVNITVTVGQVLAYYA